MPVCALDGRTRESQGPLCQTSTILLDPETNPEN